MSDTVKINGVIFTDVEYIQVPKYVQPVEGEPEPEPEYVYYRHTRNLTSPINIAEVFAGTATEINDFNGEINGVLSTRVMNGNGTLQSLILPAVTSTSGETCRSCGNLRYVKMDSCRSISYRAFRDCGRLEEVDFPVLTSVAEEGFYNCGSLATASMPELLTVGTNGFYGAKFTDITFPKVTTLYGSSFRENRSLHRLNLPSLTTLSGSCIFYNDTSLLSMEFSRVTSASGEYQFELCYIEEVSLPLITYINYRLFRNSRVKHIVAEKATGFGEQCFYDSSVLESLYMPNARDTVNANAFYNCRALTKLIFGRYFISLANTTNVFTNTPIANGTGYIYVHLDFLEIYRNATNWINYKDQILPLEMLEDDSVKEYTVTLVLPVNCKPNVHYVTSAGDWYGRDRIILGAGTDSLQYEATCLGFVTKTGTIAIDDTNPDITLDLSDMETDPDFNGFSVVNFDFTDILVDFSDYATLGTGNYSKYYNNVGENGIGGFSNNNSFPFTLALPDFSGMNNPTFVLEFLVKFDSYQDRSTFFAFGTTNNDPGISVGARDINLWKSNVSNVIDGLDFTDGFHHVAIVSNATTSYVYIDGVLMRTVSDGAYYNAFQTTTKRIGNRPSNTNEYYKGRVKGVTLTIRDIADPSVAANCEFLLSAGE